MRRNTGGINVSNNFIAQLNLKRQSTKHERVTLGTCSVHLEQNRKDRWDSVAEPNRALGYHRKTDA